MKKVLLLKFSLLCITHGYSQFLDFTLADPQPNLEEVWAGTFASGDIDGDGDKDLFLIGITPAIRTKLYLNDGVGNFTDIPHPFPFSSGGQAILKDLDNDSDLDLFYAGRTFVGVVFTNIYRNDGLGGFTQVTNNALPKFFWPAGAAMEDVDNDGDQDMVISASATTGFVADVYLNDGNAVFTAQGSSAFTAVKGAVEFLDIENDGDKDVLISGSDFSNVYSIKLYQNNGSGNFTLNTNSTFAALSGEDIDAADTDNDGDFDFLVNGNNQNLLYTNNGTGIFTQVTTTLQQTSGGQNAIADLDNDGDQDLLIVGTQPGGLPNIYNIVYQNAGNNVFIPVDTLGGEYIAACVVDNFNGDDLKDIIIQGFSDQTNVYWNASNITLPLKLLSFAGKIIDENILLNWTTANEANTDYFIIERSVNGLSYSNDGTINAMNSPSTIHNYQYQVKNTVNGLNYFRLKMVDQDGKFTTSNVLSFRLNATTIRIYPSVTNSVINVYNPNAQKIMLYNATGQYLQNLLSGQNDISHLPSGIYFVKTNDTTIRIIKQ